MFIIHHIQTDQGRKEDRSTGRGCRKGSGGGREKRGGGGGVIDMPDADSKQCSRKCSVDHAGHFSFIERGILPRTPGETLLYTRKGEKNKQTGKSFVSATSSILPGPSEFKNDLISETAKH